MSKAKGMKMEDNRIMASGFAAHFHMDGSGDVGLRDDEEIEAGVRRAHSEECSQPDTGRDAGKVTCTADMVSRSK